MAKPLPWMHTSARPPAVPGVPPRRHFRIACPMIVGRAAIVACLALGIAFDGPGAALAETGSAGRAQYGPPPGQMLPRGATGDLQAEAQAGIHENSGELPLTGLAVIPVLLGGALLLSTGSGLRHRSRRREPRL